MANKFNLKNTKVIYFSRWSRKSYAVLASIGKVVHIGNVISKVADLSLIKLEKTISICIEQSTILFNEIVEINNNEIEENNTLVQLKPITAKSKNEKKIRH